MHDDLRLSVFVKFYGASLTLVSPAMVTRWRRDLRAAVERHANRPGTVVGSARLSSIEALNATTLRALQRDCRLVIDNVLADRGPMAGLDTWPRLWCNDVPICGAAVFAGEAFTDVALRVLAHLVRPSERAPARLRRCAECQRLFVRHRKQSFCSPACANRARQRAWRDRQRRQPRRTA